MFDVILACGSRDAPVEDWEFTVGNTIAKNMVLGGLLIHGDARGIDRMSEGATEFLDRRVERYPAKWDEHKKAAGPIRNAQMLSRLLQLKDEGKSVAVFAFHNDIQSSMGTLDMASRTRRAEGVPLFVVNSAGKAKMYE